MSCDLWNCPEVPLIGPGLSRLRAASLHRASLCKYKDAMRGKRFITTKEAQDKFGLKLEERGAWEAATRVIKEDGRSSWSLMRVGLPMANGLEFIEIRT
jgi:hypothetical protein